MKNRSLLFVSLSLLALSSCTDNIELVKSVNPGQELIFTASFGDEPDTKTIVQSDGKSIWWSAHEAINIFYGDSEGSKFTSTNGEPVAKAKFTGSIEGFTGETESGELNSFWAIYPYDEANTCDGSSITATLPGYQTGKAETFSDKQWMTMAKSPGLALSFYAVGAGFRFSVTKSGVTSVVFRGNNNEVIAGKAKIGMDANNHPVVQEHLSEMKEIVLLAPDGETFEVGKLYYLAFYPTNFTQGFTITFNTMTESGTRVYNKAINFTRTDVHRGVDFDQSVVYGPQQHVVFADANFKAYCVANFDKDHDGEISNDEALAVTEMDFYTDNITSLYGISCFKNLNSLKCIGSLTWDSSSVGLAGEYGQLTSVDVSNNLALKELFCYNNQLTSIDVSKNTALTILDCYNNQLTSIDVSKNTALTILDCSGNQLTIIDVSKNTALTSLGCGGNQLTSIDISKNTALTTLGCGGNQLTSIDVSKNTALTYLDCFSSQLTRLDVSHNHALYWLQCDSNQLTSLDLSHNHALYWLDCHSNHLTSLNLSGCTELVFCICNSNHLTSLDVNTNTALYQLFCHSNQLQSLSLNTDLCHLLCGSNQLTTLDVSQNAKLLSLECQNNQLANLDVSNNPLLKKLACENNLKLTEIWLKTGQVISTLTYDNEVATIKYK